MAAMRAERQGSEDLLGPGAGADALIALIAECRS